MNCCTLNAAEEPRGDNVRNNRVGTGSKRYKMKID